MTRRINSRQRLFIGIETLFKRAEAAEAEVERLTAELADRDRRIEAALTLHSASGECAICNVCSDDEHLALWPCATVRALRGKSWPGMCACGLIDVGLEGAAVVAERRKYGTVTHSWDECYAVPYDGIGVEAILRGEA